MKSILFTVAIGLSIPLAQAQQKTGIVEPGEHLNCKHNEMLIKRCQAMGIDYENDPSTIAYEQQIQEIIKSQALSGERSATYVIPIVFHIVHIGGVENISDAQVHDAVAILNRDFQKMNADTSVVVPEFAGNIANVGFEFRLAQKDALGNCVSGITRTFSATTNDGDDNMVDQVNLNLNGGSSTSNIRYPRNKYLNIWVCKNAAGAAGYTNTPSTWTPADLDGIWIGYNYCGSIEAGSVSTSRALTHEVGHWFNLRHVWGNTNDPGVSCGNDLVTDTPVTKGWTTCNLTSNDVCNDGIVENVQNYMEYAYCSRMFTNGQKSRMIAAITSSTGGRDNLWKTATLNAAGVNGPDNLCDANFSADQTVICQGDSIAFTDASFHGPTSWSWTFASGTPASSTDQNPVVTYNTQGQYTVNLSSTNASGTMAENKTNYITVLDPVGAAVPIIESFESVVAIPNMDWFITNSDGMQTWEVVSGFGATGTKCIKLNNFAFGGEGAKDNLLSKTYDLSGVGNAQLRFKYAYKQRAAANNEKLKVYVSNNCGQTWSLRKQIAGNALSGSVVSTSAFTTPGASDWFSYDVTNITAAYYTQGFRFRIEFESDGGNNIYIDDINIDINVGAPEITQENLSFNVYPNPVNTNATIDYTMAASGKVEIKLTDVVGRTVAILESGNKPAGNQKVQLNTAQLNAKGVYFVTLQAGNVNLTRKIVVE